MIQGLAAERLGWFARSRTRKATGLGRFLKLSFFPVEQFRYSEIPVRVSSELESRAGWESNPHAARLTCPLPELASGTGSDPLEVNGVCGATHGPLGPSGRCRRPPRTP